MDKFTLSLWLRVLRALALASFTGVSQYTLASLATEKLKAAASIGLLCLMSTIVAVPLGMLADVGNFQVSIFMVFFEPLNGALLLTAAVLSALQIWFSRMAAKLGAISKITFLLVQTSAALAFVAFGLTCFLFTMSFHRVGKNVNVREAVKARHVEKYPVDDYDVDYDQYSGSLTPPSPAFSANSVVKRPGGMSDGVHPELLPLKMINSRDLGPDGMFRVDPALTSPPPSKSTRLSKGLALKFHRAAK